MLGNIPADALRMAVNVARVQRGLAVVESTQVGLLWRVARLKMLSFWALPLLWRRRPVGASLPRPRGPRQEEGQSQQCA